MNACLHLFQALKLFTSVKDKFLEDIKIYFYNKVYTQNFHVQIPLPIIVNSFQSLNW